MQSANMSAKTEKMNETNGKFDIGISAPCPFSIEYSPSKTTGKRKGISLRGLPMVFCVFDPLKIKNEGGGQ